jgi:hypothetical protein
LKLKDTSASRRSDMEVRRLAVVTKTFVVFMLSLLA